MINNKVMVYANNDFHSVHLLKSMLSDEGIDSFILNQKDSAYQMIGEEEIYVSPDDSVAALEIVRKFESETSSD